MCTGADPPHYYVCSLTTLPAPCVSKISGNVVDTYCCPCPRPQDAPESAEPLGQRDATSSRNQARCRKRWRPRGRR
jgi:hypothetical protein